MTRTLIKISRPRFWAYLFGPFLIGAIAAKGTYIDWERLLPLGLFFTFPANLLVYGFNDIFDYDTDKHNNKKKGYEHLLAPEKRNPLLWQLMLWGGLGMLLVSFRDVPTAAKWAMTGFYFFGLFYSVPPIRAKARPLLDSLFNMLYVFPGLVSYGLLTAHYPPLHLFAAAVLWCMAMHAYSAIPDITADKKAKLSTIATSLGYKGTLMFCWFCYLLAAALSYKALGILSIVVGGVYSVLIALSLKDPNEAHIFRIYKYFPLVNLFMGMGLFFYIALVVKN